MFSDKELNSLFKFALALSDEQQDAFDLLQGSLEKCLTASPDIEHKMAFARKVIKNRYIDQFRRKQRIKEEFFDEESVVPMDLELRNLEDLYLHSHEADRVWSILEADEKEILYLWAIEEYTIQEIADQQNKPKGTLLAKVHRLKKKIQNLLGREFEVQEK